MRFHAAGSSQVTPMGSCEGGVAEAGAAAGAGLALGDGSNTELDGGSGFFLHAIITKAAASKMDAVFMLPRRIRRSSSMARASMIANSRDAHRRNADGLGCLCRRFRGCAGYPSLALRPRQGRQSVRLPGCDGDRFFTVKDGVRCATPLFLVLVVVEFTDLLFAVDSVPAVLAISSDVSVVYTSNVMAILGLRALYFVRAGMMGRFHHLGTGLALILLFICAKMTASSFIRVPELVSLGVIATVLTVAIVASLLRPARDPSTPQS